jgi:CrcB protein
MMVLWVALGGAIGSGLRYGVNVLSGRFLGVEFPWHTLIVNVVGCTIMGFIVTAMALRWNLSQEMRAFLTTGILGGFTTFSAFALDFALLLERRDYLLAGGYAAASVFLSLAGVLAGIGIARMMHS